MKKGRYEVVANGYTLYRGDDFAEALAVCRRAHTPRRGNVSLTDHKEQGKWS